MSDDPAGLKALLLSNVTDQALRSHEELCAERYNTINTKIEKLESIMKWFGGLVVTAVISVLAWSINQQLETGKAQRDAAAAKIELLQKQVNESNAARKQVLEHLMPPPAAGEP